LHKAAIVGRAFPSTVITILVRRLIRSLIGSHITAARVLEFLGFTIAVGFTGLIDDLYWGRVLLLRVVRVACAFLQVQITITRDPLFRGVRQRTMGTGTT